jgi:hypothetical protein
MIPSLIFGWDGSISCLVERHESIRVLCLVQGIKMLGWMTNLMLLAIVGGPQLSFKVDPTCHRFIDYHLKSR